jgi:hypothetical protein
MISCFVEAFSICTRLMRPSSHDLIHLLQEGNDTLSRASSPIKLREKMRFMPRSLLHNMKDRPTMPYSCLDQDDIAAKFKYARSNASTGLIDIKDVEVMV